MGNSSSSTSDKQSLTGSQIDKLLADPKTPTLALIKARNTVYKQKTEVSKYEQRALNTVLYSVERSRRADDQFKKLSRAINDRTSSTRRQISNKST